MSVDEDIVRHSVFNTTLDAEPSCVEFAPLLEGVFVVGTYTLSARGKENDEETTNPSQTRSGRLLVYKLDVGHIATFINARTVSGAILDLHFAPQDQDTLAVAQSDGILSLWRLAYPSSVDFQCLQRLQISDPSILILSLAWRPLSHTPHQIAVSLSNGCISIIALDKDWNSNGQRSVLSHSLEAWTLAWAGADANIEADTKKCTDSIYTGGDDAMICQWDLDLLEENGTARKATAEQHLAVYVPEQRCRGSTPYTPTGLRFDIITHEAGVTAILPLCGNEQTIVTGSYDEHVRVMSTKPLGRWQVRSELRLGGGVWRLKLLRQQEDGDEESHFVLASCMHAGSRVLLIRRTGVAWSIDLVGKFEEHESMNYGSDGIEVAGVNASNQYVMVSTSFYDRKLCVWKICCG